MPDKTWTKRRGNDSVIFQEAKAKLLIEVTDGDYEAHYEFDKKSFLELMRKIGVIFDNYYHSTFERIVAEGKWEQFVAALPSAGVTQFVSIPTDWDDDYEAPEPKLEDLPICVVCGSRKKMIIYGMLAGPVDENIYHVGGCLLGPDSPGYFCPKCDAEEDLSQTEQE